MTEKISILKQIGKTGTHSSPHPQHSTLQLGGNPQHPAPPEEQRDWTTDLASELLWLPPKGLAPKSLNSESP